MANFPRYDGCLYIDAYEAELVRNLSVGGTFTLTGAATLNSTLRATGAVTFTNTLGVTGATTLSSTLGVTGATTLSSTLGVTGATTLSSTLAAGATTITGLIDGTGDITRTGDMTLTNTTTGAGGITVTSSDASGDSKLDLTTTGGTFQIFQNQDGNSTISNSDGIITIGAGGTLNGTTLWLGASTNTTSVRGIELTTTGQSGTNVTAGTVKVNPNAANVDFSVSGDSVADLISVDAGNDTFTLKAQSLPSTPSTGTLAIDSGASNTLKFYNGSAWVDTAGGAGTSWQTTAKTADFTAVAGEGYFVNTNGGAVTMTLPASPSGGDEVKVVDYGGDFNTNNLTITSASEKIRGTTDDYTASLDRMGVSLVYSDATQGWQTFGYAKEEAINPPSPSYVTATGGTITTDGDHKVHSFTSSGTFTISDAGNPSGSNTFDVLVVAGAGGAAGGVHQNFSGGAGGAGGYVSSTGVSAAVQAYTVVVGAGGAGGAGGPGSVGSPGTDSSFTGQTSAVGGGFGNTDANGAGGPGGSGGGGSSGEDPSGPLPQGGPGTPGQGFDGEAGSGWNVVMGGGGGGAAEAGNTDGLGAGGDGLSNSITGAATFYAGGGGGGGNGAAGDGGGGAGGSGAGGAGTANTGGGGGGGNHYQNRSGGAGGSGIVIVRYKFQN